MSYLLKQPVTLVKGIGEERAEDLHSLGIKTIEDVLLYFPFRYEDRRIRDLAEAEHDEKITVEGTIHSEANVRFYGRKKSRLSIKILVDRYLLTAVMFNRHYAKQQFKIGNKIRVSGKLDKHRMQLTVQDYNFLKENDVPSPSQQEKELIPIYSVSGGITTHFLKKIIQHALQQFGDSIPELLPETMLQRYKLMSRREAIHILHRPTDFNTGKWAKRRMVFEELFLFQLKMHALKKVRREQQVGITQRIEKEKVQYFLTNLPFSLTHAQEKVLTEIITELESPFSMNRLLQGDVGSGKTIVAAISLYASISAGYQGALMVPTEILAEQHYQSLQETFQEHEMQISLLTGSTKARERKDIIAGIQMGTIDLLIGTHALIQDDVYFKNLGLVIIDEQHRFGVGQRRKLRQKGKNPDVLFMTATPIPRTLAITALGDMDVSIIDQLPVGRKPIETYWAKSDMFERILEFIKKELSLGRQVYFICPLIEESDKLDVQNAIDVYAQLSQVLPDHYVGLLHGRLSTPEKEEIMLQFSANKIQILVATTVVEVGVNVPNATLMIVQDADRFGLAQLHQLRGRVGRGQHQSYCILIADPKTELGKERMMIMKETTSGFELAQKDLELRGPGDFFGKKQSGLPEFKLADLVHDYRALEVAREDAGHLIKSNSFWVDNDYEQLREYLMDQGVLEADKLD